MSQLNVITTCDRCAKFGLCYQTTSNSTPEDYIWGNPFAEVWIIGLNPKLGSAPQIITETKQDFANFKPENSHPYFDDFKKVSSILYNNFQNSNNVAHTDLLKCASENFPPTKKRKDNETIIANCFYYLEQQIDTYKPKVIICNGSPVSWEFFKKFNPPTQNSWKEITSYKTTRESGKHNFWIIASGFIGRIDDWSKRRLGIEIEKICADENIQL